MNWRCVWQVSLDNTLPAVRALIHDHRQRRLVKLGEGQDLHPNWQPYLQLELKHIEAAHKFELARRELFQRKAQAYLTSVAVASAFFFGLTTFVNRSTALAAQPDLRTAILLLTILASLSFLMSAWTALQVISPAGLYDISLQARLHQGKPITEDDEKCLLISAIHMNQTYVLGWAELVRASYIGMRNGVGLLAIVLLIVLGYT